MNEDKFWELIERAIDISKNDPDKKLEAIKEGLNQLSPEEVAGFSKIFEQKDADAYSWDLWAAAYIINGGCSDDAFSDFRASLITSGQKIYEEALSTPDSLAALDIESPEEHLFYEGYQYLPFEVYEAKTSKNLPDSGVSCSSDPKGKEWNEDSEDDLKRICPNLFDKYWENWV